MSSTARSRTLPEGLDIPVRLDPAPPADARAVQVSTSEQGLAVEMVDGRTVFADWHDLGTLRRADPVKRLRCEVLDDGRTIGFPDLDEYVSVPALLGYPD